jgi:hypothetical protein
MTQNRDRRRDIVKTVNEILDSVKYERITG